MLIAERYLQSAGEGDTLIIGGGMAFTFLKAQGKEVGNSLVDDTKLEYCREMMEKAEKLGKKLLLPVDAAVALHLRTPLMLRSMQRMFLLMRIPADMMGLDMGLSVQSCYAEAVKTAKTVVWNGPMGVFENPTLAAGTIAVAKALAETEATTIIGGGDSAAAVNQLGFADKMSHISTRRRRFSGIPGRKRASGRSSSRRRIRSRTATKEKEYVQKENYCRKLEDEYDSHRGCGAWWRH